MLFDTEGRPPPPRPPPASGRARLHRIPKRACAGVAASACFGRRGCAAVSVSARPPSPSPSPAIARARTARRRSGRAGTTIALQAAAVDLWVTLTPPRQRRATSSITVSVTGPRRAAGRRLIATSANLSTRFRGSLGESVNVSGRREVDDCDVRHGNTSFRVGTRCVAAIRLLPFPISREDPRRPRDATSSTCVTFRSMVSTASEPGRPVSMRPLSSRRLLPPLARRGARRIGCLRHRRRNP